MQENAGEADNEAEYLDTLDPQDRLAVIWVRQAVKDGKTGKDVIKQLEKLGSKFRNLTDLKVGDIFEFPKGRSKIQFSGELSRALGIEILKAAHQLRVEKGGKVSVPYPRPGDSDSIDPKRSYVFIFSAKQYANIRRIIAPEGVKGRGILRRIFR